MPRSPILSREGFYTRLPNNGGFTDLGFNLVNTSLGGMIETVSIQGVSTGIAANGSAVAVDVYDASFDKISEMNMDTVYRLFNISGLGVFQNFAR